MSLRRLRHGPESRAISGACAHPSNIALPTRPIRPRKNGGKPPFRPIDVRRLGDELDPSAIRSGAPGIGPGRAAAAENAKSFAGPRRHHGAGRPISNRPRLGVCQKMAVFHRSVRSCAPSGSSWNRGGTGVEPLTNSYIMINRSGSTVPPYARAHKGGLYNATLLRAQAPYTRVFLGGTVEPLTKAQ